MSSAPITFTGTLEDAASFLRCSERTLRRWLAEKPPRMAHFRIGHAVRIGEEAMLDAVAGGRLESNGALVNRNREVIRAEWRAHVAARAAAVKVGPELAEQLNDLRGRLSRLESMVFEHGQQKLAI